MDLLFLKSTKTIKFQAFIISAALLFIVNLFFMEDVIKEIAVFLVIGTLILYLMDLMKFKQINPVSMVMNVAILNAIVLLIILVSQHLVQFRSSNFFNVIVNFLYVLIVAGSMSYLYIIFKELYFLRQKKDMSTYFNTMVIFFLLTALSTLLPKSLDFIEQTFFIVSIIIMIFNSVKISWIAFVVKKEKIYLLILSIIIIVLMISIANSLKEIEGYSEALSKFVLLLMIYGGIYNSILFFTALFHLPTADAFDRKNQEISSLQYFSTLITQVLDFSDLTDSVTDIALKICDANAAWIILREEEGYKSIALKNIGYFDSNLLNHYLVKEKNIFDVNSIKVFTLEKFQDKGQLSEKYHTIAAAPLKVHNESKGFLIAVKKENMLFDEEDRNALNTFSDYASVAFDNSRLVKESIEKERMEKELDLARDIQMRIIPTKLPEFRNLEISSLFIPAFEVGGDYYDFFEIDEDKLGFVIADVSGKGISAAFIMAELKGIFESLSKTISTPKDILITANSILKRTLNRNTFVSAAFGVLELKTGKLNIVRAGHCPILLIRDDKIKNIKPTGIGLGLTFEGNFSDNLEEKVIFLQQNDMIVLYTDGITEAKNKELEDFGQESFEEVLLNHREKEVDEISKNVIHEVTMFSQHNLQHDDITLVILKWKQKLNIDGDREWQSLVQQLNNQTK